jgi:hypothetical protein
MIAGLVDWHRCVGGEPHCPIGRERTHVRPGVRPKHGGIDPGPTELHHEIVRIGERSGRRVREGGLKNRQIVRRGHDQIRVGRAVDGENGLSAVSGGHAKQDIQQRGCTAGREGQEVGLGAVPHLWIEQVGRGDRRGGRERSAGRIGRVGIAADAGGIERDTPGNRVIQIQVPIVMPRIAIAGADGYRVRVRDIGHREHDVEGLRGRALNIKHQFDGVHIAHVRVARRAVGQAGSGTHNLQIASGAGESGNTQEQCRNCNANENVLISFHTKVSLLNHARRLLMPIQLIVTVSCDSGKAAKENEPRRILFASPVGAE